MSSRGAFENIAPGLVGNLLILGVLALAGGLVALAPEHYYRAVQEDSYIEWASFWAFALAGCAFAGAALRQQRAARRVPWFTLCVGAFCFLVALEEISWGQRLIGYRPQSFFLEQNFQQELNFHNIIASDLRELGVELVILTYGILLPVAMHVRRIGPWLERWGTAEPPLSLIPAFAAMLAVYLWYPWNFTGEWVELSLGLGFLFAAIVTARRDAERSRLRTGRQGLRLALAWLAAVGLGAATTAVQSARASSDPTQVAAAQVELDALSTDLKPLLTASHCGVHKRLYTLVRDRRWDFDDGRFAELAVRGAPRARVEYLLDPWNLPYWVRDRCADSADPDRLVYLYSFGPNRRRDSTELGIAGDDVGILFELDSGDE